MRREGHLLRAAMGIPLVWMSALCTVAWSAPDKPWAIPSNGQIGKLLAERLRHNGVGVVVGLIEPAGRRVVAHGRSGAMDRRPLDGDTVFQIGSITKVFTTLLLADMAVRGEVGLDDTAAKLMPPGAELPQNGRPITLRDLATHHSGLPSMPSNFDLYGEPNPYEAYTVGQLHEFLGSFRLEREPGTTREYSNLGVALLGRLLARRAGISRYAPADRRGAAPGAGGARAAHDRRARSRGAGALLRPLPTA